MKSELVVDVQPSEITTAFVEDGKLMELNREPRDMNYAVGNIYYGKIKKIMPALNAAFVDIGHEKDAFLHYLDLGTQFNSLNGYVKQVVSNRKQLPSFPKNNNHPIVGKLGSIEDLISLGQNILVQVTKEPINTKGPRLTAEISIAGRYLVLIPFQDKVMVSGKIKGETEKNRLKKIVNSIKPKGYGVIIRTVAADVGQEELQREMNILYKRWEDAILKLQKAEPVSLISAEIGRTIGIIRDVYNSSFDHIYVNDNEMYTEIKDYVELIAPERTNIVKLYNDNQPIFDYFDITRQTKVGLGRTVSFKNGGYLIMERTEALFSIDVNSGTRKVGEDQEENAFNMNIAAADVIAHQLRLRDIGGIIIVDFIDMTSSEHRQKLYDYMRNLMNKDRAKHNVLPLSKFGLMQITRQRVRPVVEIEMDECCPTCQGKGKIQSSYLFTDQLESLVQQMVEKNGKDIRLYVHPYVFAYLSKGWIFSAKTHWRFRYGLKHLYENQSLGFLEYRFTDKQGKALKVDFPQPTTKKLIFDDEKPQTVKEEVVVQKQVLPVHEEIKQIKVVQESTLEQQQETEKKSKRKRKKSSADSNATLEQIVEVQQDEVVIEPTTKSKTSKSTKKTSKEIDVASTTAILTNSVEQKKSTHQIEITELNKPSKTKSTRRKTAKADEVVKDVDSTINEETLSKSKKTTKSKSRTTAKLNASDKTEESKEIKPKTTIKSKSAQSTIVPVNHDETSSEKNKRSRRKKSETTKTENVN